LIRSGVYERIMLIGAETLSKILDKEDRSTAILFGDGAGAVILERSAHDSFIASDLGADGSRPELLYAHGSGARRPLDHAALDEKVHLIHMQGRETFKLAVQRMVDATDSVLKKANLSKADVTFLIPHQANRRIIDATARYLDLPEEKVVVNIAEYGNTSAASIPMALSETVRAGLVKPEDLIVFVAFGGGLSWGAVAWRWAA
jgi:3-oxoacyl-[acyl-carrier-protein] synthase III